MADAKMCMCPDCKQRSYVRGLCVFHYRVACGLVKRNQTTWDQLESAGRCLPPRPTGRRADESAEWFLRGGS